MKIILNKASFTRAKTDKEIDDNNFLVAYDVPIAKTGIQQYSREELGDKDGDPKEMVNVFRDQRAFDDPKVLESFDGIPIVYQHPDDGKVDNLNFKEFVVGTVSGVYVKNGDLYAKKLTIIDKRAIVDVLSKRTNELSIGFRGSVEKVSGRYNGKPYEFKENVMYANHLALCEEGKAGSYYAINSKKGKQKMDFRNESRDEKDCMNSGDIEPKDVSAHVRGVKSKMEKVRPELHDSKDDEDENMKNEEDDGEDDHEDEEELERKEKKMEGRNKKMKKNESDPSLEESEEKDKDLIEAYKNSHKKLKMLINKKNKEISSLEFQNVQLEEALMDARDMMKKMADKMKSTNLVNAMSGPNYNDFPANRALDKDMHRSLTNALLLK